MSLETGPTERPAPVLPSHSAIEPESTTGEGRWHPVGDRIEMILAPVVMLAFVTWVYRRIVAGQVLAGGDLQLYFFPYWTAVVRSLRDGSLPLWNTYLFAGSPLLANSQVGVFYPLNWPFWLLSPSSLLGITRAIHWSVVLHLWLAAASVYVLCRRTAALGRWPSALAGVIYAGSGFLGVHVDHLNQLQALAWLPLLFLPEVSWGGIGHPGEGGGPEALDRPVWRGLWMPNPLSILAFSMILLAGHTQMAFIGGCGLAVWHLVRSGRDTALGRGVALSMQIGRWLLAFVVRMMPFALAGLIAAVQLLPTLTLADLSGRGGGLDWREAVSFSVPPWELLKVLLPPYIASPLLPEGVAYLGIPALLLAALGGWRSLRSSSPRERGLGRWAWLVIAAMGVLLALGGYNPLYLAAVRLGIPGFIHFRAPARFLALYVLAGSVLAGIGLETVRPVEPRPGSAWLESPEIGAPGGTCGGRRGVGARRPLPTLRACDHTPGLHGPSPGDRGSRGGNTGRGGGR